MQCFDNPILDICNDYVMTSDMQFGLKLNTKPLCAA